MTPSVGRIVHYVLNEVDAEAINRRRTTSRAIAERIQVDAWPLGAQAHIGNEVRAGDVFPMVIVRVWPLRDDHPVWSVNGQVLLDGSDTYWATSREQAAPDCADKQGLWFEPPRVA